MKIFAETKRLILREIVPSDVVGLFELDSDPEVHKYLGNRQAQDRQGFNNLGQNISIFGSNFFPHF